MELNNSFYRLPSERAFLNWEGSTPPHFLYFNNDAQAYAVANARTLAQMLGEPLPD